MDEIAIVVIPSARAPRAQQSAQNERTHRRFNLFGAVERRQFAVAAACSLMYGGAVLVVMPLSRGAGARCLASVFASRRACAWQCAVASAWFCCALLIASN